MHLISCVIPVVDSGSGYVEENFSLKSFFKI